MNAVHVVTGWTIEGSSWNVRAFAEADGAVEYANVLRGLVADVNAMPKPFGEACRGAAGLRLLRLDPDGDNRGPFIPAYGVVTVPFGPVPTEEMGR